MKKPIFLAVVLSMCAAVPAATIEVKVYGMVCGFCVQGVEKNLRALAATSDVVVSLENKLVVVATREGEDISDVELTRAIVDAGYDVKGIQRTQRSIDEIRGLIQKAAK